MVAFFRTLGGAIGVSAFGAVLSHKITTQVTDGVAALVQSGKISLEQAKALSGDGLPSVSQLHEPLKSLFEGAFGDATGQIFLFTVPCAVFALVAVLFVKENRLRTTLDMIEEPELNMEIAAELEAGELNRR